MRLPNPGLFFVFLLLFPLTGYTQHAAFLKLLDTVPYMLDRDFEANDMVVTKDAIYIVGAEKVADTVSRYHPFTPYPCLVKLGLNNRLAWKKIIPVPLKGECGLSAIAENNGRLFVAGMSSSDGFIMEITTEGDTLWSTFLDNPNSRNPANGHVMRSGNKVYGEKILCLFAHPDGRVIAGGKAKDDFTGKPAGFVQCVYPKEKRTPCYFFLPQDEHGWSQVNGITATDSGFVLATNIGMTEMVNFTLVFTDHLLKETKRTVLHREKRAESHTALSYGGKVYSGGESKGNFFAMTSLSGDSICSFNWAHERQNDVLGLAGSGDHVLALHQLGDNSGVTLFSGCDTVSTLAFRNRVDAAEHPVAVHAMPGGGYVVLTRTDDYTSSIEKSIEYCIVRFLSPKLEITSTLILLHITP